MVETRENDRPLPVPPTEPKGVTVGEPAPPVQRFRGYLPPIVDDLPPAALRLPKMWLSFSFDREGQLQCLGAIQRANLERITLDTRDPTIAQGYAYFLRVILAQLDPGAVPELGPEQLEEIKTDPNASPEP